jgi:hypothetical protein
MAGDTCYKCGGSIVAKLVQLFSSGRYEWVWHHTGEGQELLDSNHRARPVADNVADGIREGERAPRASEP